MRAAVVYRRHELQELRWDGCSDCGETIVVARTPDGWKHLDTVPDGGAPGEPGYEEHECSAARG